MYRELTISSDVPAPRLTKALKTCKLSLTADQLKGSGSVIHLHLTTYEKVIKARKAGRGVRLDITRHEIKKGYKRAQGGSIWTIKSLTGVGIYDSDSDVEKEGGRILVADVKKGAKRAISYAKRKGVLTDRSMRGEVSTIKAIKPEHENLIKSIRGEVKRRYGVGVPKKKPAKGSPEMKAKMAALRAKRKKPTQTGSFRL
ncbi:unnamed protein product [Phytophthora lilii]|uniref:Unnamed protein product n=1 Tax=Phytophthora lilii TaxID=2077276 RepID=A0A9W6XJW5_9STRA|nr:unnamed protein product [Phytophthora lilii]